MTTKEMTEADIEALETAENYIRAMIWAIELAKDRTVDLKAMCKGDDIIDSPTCNGTGKDQKLEDFEEKLCLIEKKEDGTIWLLGYFEQQPLNDRYENGSQEQDS